MINYLLVERFPIPYSLFLISAEQMMIECFRLNDSGIWELYTYAKGHELKLTYLDFTCPAKLVYKNVVLEVEK